DVSPDLLLVDVLDRLVEPSTGLAIFRRKILRVCDEGQAFESTDDIGRQLPIHVAHAEVVVPRDVPHSECRDKGWDDKGSIELEGLEPVASQELLLDEGTEQLHPFAKTPAMVVDAANERLAIEWRDLDRVALVEQEDDLAVDLSHEELVRRGDRQHREVDEEELAGLLEAVEFLEDPGGGGPGLFVDEPDRRKRGEDVLHDPEGLRDHRVIDDDVQVDVGPNIDPMECGCSALVERMDEG